VIATSTDWNSRLAGENPGTPKGAEPVRVSPHEVSNVPPVSTLVGHVSESWYALWTHSHCEQLVRDQLLRAGYRAFLPTVDVWSRRRGVRRLIDVPMFPGYLFLRHAIDKKSYCEVSRVRGVVRVLGERWDSLARIPDEEMESIERIAMAREPVLPYPYLKEGRRVRIVAGPLAGLEGILVKSRLDKGLLVLSVHLLQRSVAMSVDATAVAPA
jgi:transcriptional antiterminator NusG